MKHDNLFKPLRLSWVNNYSLWLFLFSLSDYSVKSIDLFSSFLATLTQLQRTKQRESRFYPTLVPYTSLFSTRGNLPGTWNYRNFTFSLLLKTESDVLVLRSRVSIRLCFKCLQSAYTTFIREAAAKQVLTVTKTDTSLSLFSSKVEVLYAD